MKHKKKMPLARPLLFFLPEANLIINFTCPKNKQISLKYEVLVRRRGRIFQEDRHEMGSL